MAWLTGWNIRKQLNINNTSTPQSSYQMKIIINYGSGTDGTPAANIYCNNNADIDFRDIRFTDTNGTTLLNYWIETYTPSSSATVWVKIPSIPPGTASTYIYFYYNNPSPPSTGQGTGNDDGPATFLFFDHFLGSSINTSNWSTRTGVNITVSGGNLQVKRETTADHTLALYSKTSFGDFTAIRTRLNMPWSPYTSCSGGSWGWNGFGYETGSFGNLIFIFGIASRAGFCGSLVNYVGAWVNSPISGDSNTHIWEIARTNSASYAMKDNSLAAGPFTSQYPSGTNLPVGFKNEPNTGSDNYYVDWILIRKYNNPEPIFGTVGSIQSIGNLSISSTPSGATIYIDDVVQPGIITPAIITNLNSGSHTYKLTLSEYQDSTGSFSITAGQTTTVSITLTPFAGSLDISSTPSGARIYIDDVDQGVYTPYTISDLTPVSHDVKLTLTNYSDYTTSVIILSNQTASINPTLTLSPGMTKVQASPSFVQSSYIGEIIDIGTLKIEWNGTGTIILEKTLVYDRLVLTGPNGIFDHTWTPCGAIVSEGPFDITNIFTPGYNEIIVKIYNVCGGNIGTTTGSIDITGPITLACPITQKYSGDTITLQATPKDGIGPYYVEFSKEESLIDPARLGGANPIYNAPENITITRTYQLTDEDIRNALTGTIKFGVFMSDSCPTSAQTCTQDCIINIGCISPICNFTVT